MRWFAALAFAVSVAVAADLRDTLGEFREDEAAIERFYPERWSPNRAARLRQLYRDWRDRLATVSFDPLDAAGRVDYVLFRHLLDYRLRRLAIDERRFAEMQPLVPFARPLLDLFEARQRVEPLDAPKTAALLARLDRELRTRSAPAGSGTLAARAAEATAAWRRSLERWYRFYDGYDPQFSWWMKDPYQKLSQALAAWQSKLEPRDDQNTLSGDPAGRDALLLDLEFEMIPYTPEELIAIANREFAWCEAEMKKASRDLGFGDQWQKALEHVKDLHAAPGEQTQLVKRLALEAIAFVDRHELVTIPDLARETWRMEMMSPAQQKINPFFLGGEVIRVSFPTDTMSHDEKVMSLRGNNLHFSRATVFHELIPGHFLQKFMTERHRPERSLFSTPFWIEGWALHHEMLFWNLGFPQSAEDRIGMLFWRMHRCARIIFSLRFHLGQMTAAECAAFLVDRVGHERANAEAEVRRSFNGSYPPLYQLAYMMGALQFRALHAELVGTGQMTNRQFHDAVLRQNSIPVEILRAALKNTPVTPDFKSTWRFAGDPIRP